MSLLIIQIAIGAYAFLQIRDTEDLKASVKQVVEKSFNKYNETKIAKEEFDFLQSFVSNLIKSSKLRIQVLFLHVISKPSSFLHSFLFKKLGQLQNVRLIID